MQMKFTVLALALACSLLAFTAICFNSISGYEQEADTPWLVPDYGDRIHEIGRPAFWDSQSLNLADTGFIANVGPGTYKDEDDAPDYYTIDVEYDDSFEDRGKLVCYCRDINLDDLPRDVCDLKIDDIVTFKGSSRIVIFKFGERQFEYKLPLPSAN